MTTTFNTNLDSGIRAIARCPKHRSGRRSSRGPRRVMRRSMRRGARNLNASGCPSMRAWRLETALDLR